MASDAVTVSSFVFRFVRKSKLFSFAIVWFGQLISLAGSGLTSFAVGVWVYTRTRSVTEFALILACAVLPGIIIAPFAGVMVDRHNRATIMAMSDFAGAINAIVLALLFVSGHLSVWQVGLLVCASSIVDAFRLPAYIALSSQLVPASQLGRANGLMQLGPAVMQAGSPVLAAALIGIIGFQGVVLIDVITFLFAIATILAVPSMGSPAAPGSGDEKRSVLKEAQEGWRYIYARPGLLGLLLFFVVINISFSFSEVLLTPMILGFASTVMLGTIMSAGAAGLLAGSIGMSLWGGPKRHIVVALFVFAILYSVGFILTGLRPSWWLIALGLFILTLQVPLMNGCSQTIWQRKTPLFLQGRVFGMRMMIAWGAMPVAFFMAGPLADKLFEPLLAPHGSLVRTWISAIGIGEGRGIALLLVLVGILSLLITSACFLNPHLWQVEQQLPEAIQQTTEEITNLVF